MINKQGVAKRSSSALWFVLPAIALLNGCASSPAHVTTVASPLQVTGSVHGGQQPVSSAQVYLYAVATTQAGAATSLLTDAGGYVTTDANGNFSITSDYTCPSGNPSVSTYLLALGGNPGLAAGASNSAIALMAALGPCSSLSSTTSVNINELSTIAAVTALQQFMTDSTHIGAFTTSLQPSYSAIVGIPNAMLVVNNLVALSTGTALTAPVTGNGVSPQAKLNTLGNILAACINTASPSSPACTALFGAATPAGGTVPADTIAAMLSIAQNPGANVATLYNQASAAGPFQPSLAAAPNDFTLGITFTGGGLTYPGPLVVDNAGNIFIANCPSCNASTATDSIVGFSPTGAITTVPSGFVTNVHKPVVLAIDRYNGIWVGNAATSTQGNQLTRLNNTDGSVEYPVGNNSSAPTAGFPLALSGLPGGIALVEDSPADAWVADSTNGTMARVRYDGTLLQTLTTTGLANPTAIAADGLLNLYLVGIGSNSILQYSAAGTFSTLTGAGLASPISLALDGGDHVWTIDSTAKAVSEIFAYTGTPNSGSAGYGGINIATNVTIDGAGTAWIANCRASCAASGSAAADNIVHLSATGASLLPSDGLQNTQLANPTATAIDISGNLWISNTGGASMTELVGVAVPVVIELETASSRHALGAVNYLQNGGFEAGAQVKGDSSSNAIPYWTYSSSTGTGGASGVDNGSPFSGAQKLTYYEGSAYQVSETQTIMVPNGAYLVSCYVAGDPNHSSRTASINAVSGGNTFTNALASLNYSFQPYSIANVSVSNGSLTISLNDTDTNGGYVGWDSCSVTKQ